MLLSGFNTLTLLAFTLLIYSPCFLIHIVLYFIFKKKLMLIFGGRKIRMHIFLFVLSVLMVIAIGKIIPMINGRDILDYLP